MKQAYFVTGTDTDAGKTTVAAAFLYAAKQKQLTTLAMKPVASGCELTVVGLRNADALALMAQSSLKCSYQQINPYAFAPAIAPHLAAKEAGKGIQLDELITAAQAILDQPAAFTLIEGAGGWRVPISDKAYLSDLAKALKLPVILVVGIKLGCINHALLTAEAIQNDGLEIAGWVANQGDPNCVGWEAMIASLKQQMPAPCLGEIPYLAQASVGAVASYLSTNFLLHPPERKSHLRGGAHCR